MRNPITIVADNIRSLENVGSLFRVADAICAERILLIGISGYPNMKDSDKRRPWLREKNHKQIQKSALMTVDTVPFEYFPSTEECIKALKESGYFIVCAEQTSESKTYTSKYEVDFPCALVFGHEKDGVSQAFLDASDLTLEIPQYGSGKSLNVAVSAGVLSYHILNMFISQSAKL
jgi:23S rRNA (guanosine2251-2'-O)-methyltransferase